MRHRLRRPHSPVLNVRHVQHVDPLGDRFADFFFFLPSSIIQATYTLFPTRCPNCSSMLSTRVSQSYPRRLILQPFAVIPLIMDNPTTDPRTCEVRSDNLDNLCPVESDRELFASAVSVSPTPYPVKLIGGKNVEFTAHFAYVTNPDKAPLHTREAVQSASNCFVGDCVFYRSCLPGHLRKCVIFMTS